VYFLGEEREKKKKKRNDCRQQTFHLLLTRVALGGSGQDKTSNNMVEGQFWQPVVTARATHTLSCGQHTH